jgi:septum formation protein
MSSNPLQLPYIIVLGSQSPRRQQLLKGLDIAFEVKVKPTEEDFDPQMPFPEVPEYLARKKAAAFAPELSADRNLLVITADTIVALEGHILNKPENKAEAVRMLSFLSGKKHTVVTGVCLKTAQKEISFAVHTDVYFKPLSGEEIGYYVEHYSPYDKAGSYGVQEWIGYICIEKIDGSYFNVMGLPVKEVYEELLKFGTRSQDYRQEM